MCLIKIHYILDNLTIECSVLSTFLWWDFPVMPPSYVAVLTWEDMTQRLRRAQGCSEGRWSRTQKTVKAVAWVHGGERCRYNRGTSRGAGKGQSVSGWKTSVSSGRSSWLSGCLLNRAWGYEVSRVGFEEWGGSHLPGLGRLRTHKLQNNTPVTSSEGKCHGAEPVFSAACWCLCAVMHWRLVQLDQGLCWFPWVNTARDWSSDASSCNE